MIFQIEGLNGRTEPISVDLSGEVRIIYGINGSGKTTVLKILNAMLSGRLHEVRSLSFDQASLSLETGQKIVFRRSSKKRQKSGRKTNETQIAIELQSPDGGIEEKAIVKSDAEIIEKIPTHIIDSEIPELNRIGRQEWLDTTSSEVLSIGEIIERYSDRLPWLQPSSEVKWYRELIANRSVKFIQTQRLITMKSESNRYHGRPGVKYQNTIIDYAEKLKSQIRDKLSDSMRKSQDLDSTYPRRLLQGNRGARLDDNGLKLLLNKTEQLGAKLRKVDLLSATGEVDIKFESISEENRRAIVLYLKDTLDKFTVLEPFADKLLLFLEIVNSKFKPNKYVEIGGRDGIVVKLQNKDPIHSHLLSSGEQHEIVLLFDLIFFSEPQTLVLIDEPEISLHIDWQKKFLSDVEAIGRATGLRFLLATHSPAIIGGRIEICTEI